MKIVYLEKNWSICNLWTCQRNYGTIGQIFYMANSQIFHKSNAKKSTRLGDMKLKGEVDGDKLHIHVSDPNSREEVLTITLWAQEVRRAKGLTLTYKNPKTGTTAQTYYTDI
nr:uncharacterized protein LOC121122794 [Lepeophtheirus salmonis]